MTDSCHESRLQVSPLLEFLLFQVKLVNHCEGYVNFQVFER